MENVSNLLRQRQLDAPLSIKKRKELLKLLYTQIQTQTDDIAAALKADYNKNSFDSYATEIGIVLSEIKHTLRHLSSWAKPKRAKTGLLSFPSRGKIFSEPYGAVLIIAPWNYPFQLSMCPLVGAIAAGNYVCLKPSSRTKRTHEVIKQIISSVFVGGVVEVSDSRTLLDQRWDYIFFTGSPQTGKSVMASAAKNLTPVTLELGGKSPAIVDKTADILKAAKRLAWGKFINAGQTCIAPDHIIVHQDIKQNFIDAFIAEIKKQYYDASGTLSPDFAYVMTESALENALDLIKDDKLIFGGNHNGRCLEPTVVETNFDSPIMQDEIFAPIAPILTFDNLDTLIKQQKQLEKPLALYYFGTDFKKANTISYGGGCHNDVLMHVSETNLPFGGVGNSGMGNYHGKNSFFTFSHQKSVLLKGKLEHTIRYAPHTKKLENLTKKVLK